MTRRRLLTCLCAGLVLTVLPVAGCRKQLARGPSHEAVLALLQQEAAYLKKGGEDLDPSLGKVTWTVEGIDVTERPGDRTFPWAGSIRFKIHQENRDYDGNVTSDTRQKRFDYRYNAVVNQWQIDVPAPQAP